LWTLPEGAVLLESGLEVEFFKSFDLGGSFISFCDATLGGSFFVTTV
jgi:hypothetical protein